MAASGASWTSALQAKVEVSAGAGGTATRMLTDVIAPVMLVPDYKMVRQNSVRGTVHPSYNAPIITSQIEALKGFKIRATYESLPWWLQTAVCGGGTAVLTDGTAYTRTFTPSGTPANGDDRKTVSFEIGSDTGYWTTAYGVCEKFGIHMYGNKPMEVTADFACQKRTTLAAPTTLSPVAWEEINGSTFQAFLDTNTLGATAFAATEASLEIVNTYQWMYTGDGNLYPSSAIFTGYSAKLAMTVVFNSMAEYTAWLASTERKARLLIQGTLAGTATKKSLQIDWYGYWDDPVAPTDTNGVLVAKLSGECVLDATAAKTFNITTVNSLSTLP